MIDARDLALSFAASVLTVVPVISALMFLYS